MVWFKSRGWNFSMPSWLSRPRGQQAFTVLTSTQSAVTRRISFITKLPVPFLQLAFQTISSPPKCCFPEETMTRENIKSFPFQLFFQDPGLCRANVVTMFSLFQARFVYFPSSCLIFSCFLLEKSRSKWWKDAGMATSINPSTISSFPSPPHHQLYILHHKLWKYFFHFDFRDVSPSAHTSTAWFHSATLKQKGEGLTEIT